MKKILCGILAVSLLGVMTGNGNAMRPPEGANLHLHEAGLVGNAPSGNVYYDGSGEVLSNLGVHEHWNNSMDKQYSRNLEKEEGIELVFITAHFS